MAMTMDARNFKDDSSNEELQEIVAKFLHEYFYVEDAIFACRSDEHQLGNRRFNFAHYLCANVEVAMLVGPNIRYKEIAERLNLIDRANTNACYMELSAPLFMIKTIVQLETLYRVSKVSSAISIPDSTKLTFDMFEFNGSLSRAKAHFTFAKLAK